ncbi:MAG: hypothetical protein DI540_19320 [Sphingobium sp.]|nr:MAG: hypothetical protein DI540_19320 [Sphingobium sp.]
MGEAIDRPAAIATALEPRTLAAEAARRADRDAGGGLLAAIDALDIVNIASWRHDDIAALLCRDLAIDPTLRACHPVGGESPVRLLHEAALRIARGESRVVARRSLGLGADIEPSVTGGLSFFGGPLSNYMLHAACAMVRRLRGGGTGLLYGQGEFVTKHHALLLSADAAPQPLAQDYSVQADADRRRGAVPPLVEPAPGLAQVETATILYRRDGAVDQGVVVLRTTGGARTLASVSAEDQATLSRITDDSRFPVGLAGRIAADGDRMIWRAEGL